MRVSREHGILHVRLSTLHRKIDGVALAITRRSADRPGRVWAISGRSAGSRGREVFVSVWRSNEARMAFTLGVEDDGEILGSGSDLAELLETAECS